MRRNISSHTYRYTVRAVYEQIRVSCGKNYGLHTRIVEVGIEVYRILIDFAKHFERHFAHPGFGVPVRRRGVAVDRTEVAVSVDERHVYREILRKTNERAVYRTVAVGVIFTQNVADDRGALLIRFIRSQTEFVHRVKNTSVNGFKTVPYVGYRPRTVYAHGVVYKTLFKFFFYLDIYDFGHIESSFEFSRQSLIEFFFSHRSFLRQVSSSRLANFAFSSMNFLLCSGSSPIKSAK